MRKQTLIMSASTVAMATALVVGMVTGVAVPRGIPSEPIAAQHERSIEVTTVADGESFVPGTEPLTTDEVSQLSDGEVAEILEVSDDAVSDAQDEFAAAASAADYARQSLHIPRSAPSSTRSLRPKVSRGSLSGSRRT